MAVVQSAERRVVAPEVTGSRPVSHPNQLRDVAQRKSSAFIRRPLEVRLLPSRPDHAPVVEWIRHSPSKRDDGGSIPSGRSTKTLFLSASCLTEHVEEAVLREFDGIQTAARRSAFEIYSNVIYIYGSTSQQMGH